MIIKISEDEQNKTGLLKRIRQIRGYVTALNELDVNHMTFAERELAMTGFFNITGPLFDECEVIIKECIENTGESQESISVLEESLNKTEQDYYKLKDKFDELLKENVELHRTLNEK